MDSGIKLIIGFIALIASIVAFSQLSEVAKSNPVKTPSVQKLFYEGTIGGKHSMSISLDRVGEDITGSAVNTNNELRKLKGSIGKEKTFLLHEYDNDQMTGTFEGRILENGDMRGIWSAPPGGKWFPFYLHKKPRIFSRVKANSD